ncbi:MAG: ABC transporter permease [Armatimonadota bacterium]|nr:ABC transporter permease [Armatimonadota bacterium]MDR5710468.1 ABC transporter permease [Armatimonadota bacterium]MDR7390771.1 ABC transporter permease [Armatimonadota bacterium]MDR7398055.1 ABC transporter permease [Armatimonadota bacterium]MDR7477056.1 ABC transporter permease [Armatimonadota bacterium]
MASTEGILRAGVRVAPRRGLPPWLLIAPTLLLLTVFFVVPYVNMVRMSLLVKPAIGAYEPEFTLANYARALLDPFHWRVMYRTFSLAGVTTALTLVVAYPVAYHLTYAPRRRQRWLLMLLISPLLVSLVVRGFAWMILLGRVGLVNLTVQRLTGHELVLIGTPAAIVIGLVHVYVPFMALAIAGALQNIPPELIQAARSLGASPWAAFRRVVWPLSLPGVQAGTLLVFVLAVSSYVIPILLGASNVLVMPMLIVQTLLDAFNWPLGSALSMVFFGLTAGVVAVYLRLLARGMPWTRA